MIINYIICIFRQLTYNIAETNNLYNMLVSAIYLNIMKTNICKYRLFIIYLPILTI